MKNKKVPKNTIKRLPLYLRALHLLAESGETIISSQQLERRLGIGSSQIRKDLSHFGEFGKQGSGYDIAYLKSQLQQILKVDREWNVALVGAGRLGQALMHCTDLHDRGFKITAVFDNAADKIGTFVGEHEIIDTVRLGEVVGEEEIEVAIIAVPDDAAQDVVNWLVEAGIRAILNYTPFTLDVPDKVLVQNIDPVAQLQSMAYYLQ